MKIKGFLITPLLLVNTFTVSFCQSKEDKYRSNEETAYYESLRPAWENKVFRPVSIITAKKPTYDYVRITKVTYPSTYNHAQVFSIWWDSIMQSQMGNMKDFKKFDSLSRVMMNEKVGIVPKMSIIRQEKRDANWAILFTDAKYDDFIYGGWGYWVALSTDNGKTWKKYYTGLSENFYYFFKRNSGIPLWKDSNTLQIEAVIVRQTKEVIHPLPAEFELIQDSIAVLLDITAISKDSDNDGLTDVAEEKLLLDPRNPDTDGDGKMDSNDRNPRFKSEFSEKAMIYETLIENFHPDKNGEMEIDLSKPPAFKENDKDKEITEALGYPYFETVSVFVTDDTDLKKMDLHRETMIIMSTKEFEAYKEKFPSHLIKSSYSPMFKCDIQKDTFKIETSQLTGGTTYLIKKTRKGWKISILSSWIS